jgi:RNA polymerase sigma-70 factor (ECF subfamily)
VVPRAELGVRRELHAESAMSGHPRNMRRASATIEPEAAGSIAAAAQLGLAAAPHFADVYDEYFEFVWRSARRLGVVEASLDDVVQDTFVTVYRRLAVFEGRSQLKTWIFGVLRHTVRDHRRSLRRKPSESLDHEPADRESQSPHEAAVRSEGVKLLDAVLGELDDELREVFVLSELEQMSAPEVALALSLNVNTVYSRLRTARASFEAALKRLRCRDEWRSR